jgi:hypothetical protein
MYGYSGLHYLRRIAAHLAAGREVPPPGEDATLDDGAVDAYFRAAGFGGLGGLLRRKVDVDRRFDHLLLHSDAEGFYMPVSFDEVIVSDRVPGSSLGSSMALARECDELAEALSIPDGVGPEDEELWAASENQGEGDGWLAYGIEAFTCVNLRAAARASVDRGAAIVFN